MKNPFTRNYIKSFKSSYYVYAGILIGFIIWMVFIDTHSWNIHSELNSEIERLEQEKEALKLIMSSDKKTFKQLQNIVVRAVGGIMGHSGTVNFKHLLRYHGMFRPHTCMLCPNTSLFYPR